MIASHNTDFSIDFYNDKVQQVIPADDIAQPFTYIPVKARHMELIGGNVITFGNITEGYDVISPIIKTELTFDDKSDESGSILNLYIVCLEDPESPQYYVDPERYLITRRRVFGVLAIGIPSPIHVGADYCVHVVSAKEGIDKFAKYTAEEGDNPVTVAEGLKAAMDTAGFEDVSRVGSWVYMYARYKIYSEVPYEAGDINTVYRDLGFNVNVNTIAYISALGYSNKYPQLKFGATHGYGIVYKDYAGRQCSVMKFDNIYLPFYTESGGPGLGDVASLNFKIMHTPPEWADSYEIVYFGNISMNNFLTIRENDIKTLGNNRFAINIQQTLDQTRAKNGRWRVPDWSWQQGDRLRLIGYINDAGTLVKYETLYDYEIERIADENDGTLTEESLEPWFICQAKIRPYIHPGDTIFGNDTSIVNTEEGDLCGTVVHTTLNGTGVKRKDTITLSGTSGSAVITCGALQKPIEFATSLSTTATNFYNSNKNDYLAIGIDLTADGEKVIFESHTAGVDFKGTSNIVLEIYRPNKGINDTVAYGCGMVFGIETDENGHRRHKGDIDQQFDAAGQIISPAIIYNTANDCYKYLRLNYKYNSEDIQPFWVESICPSDWWSWIVENRLTNNGFPFLYDLSLRQTVLPQRIRHGGSIITGTRTNNIARFTFEDFVDLPEKYGVINAMREIGYTLKILQSYKETSIYINRIQTFNPDGTEQFTLISKLLGTQRPMEADYGLQHPDGVMVNNDYLYFWDNSQVAFIRSASNGQQVLDIKMKRWFKELSEWIKHNGGSSLLEVRIGANNDYDEIWLTFSIGEEVKGLIFNERDGRWRSELDQPTEEYIHLGSFFAHIYHQKLWLINPDEGQDYLCWAGKPTNAEIKVVSNVNPSQTKIFNGVSYCSNDEWYCPERGIKIPDEASNNGMLMETNITRWRRKEGIYYGEILKDINTKGNFVNDIDKKLNGDNMRGRYCYVLLKNERHSKKVKLESIAVYSTLSKL